MANLPATGFSYRPDIDGLRAIAVIPVILYHAGVAGFQGGYVGVDVFFVVSGYLITSIIVTELAEGRFSLRGFYERRVRRIFPALFLVVAVSMPAALIILVPEHLENFGQSVIATALFVSNFFFYFESGYFDGPADLHPLLHTWSLAVEEQFYLFFPLLLLFAARWKLPLAGVIAAFALMSFAVGAWQVSADPAAAFYLLPGRFWELMAGALLAVLPLAGLRSRATGAFMVLTGVLLICAAVVTFDERLPFPGMAALLPVFGTLAIIHGGRTANPVSALLGSRPLRQVGLISYSLYLWHFPLMVFARHLIVRPFSAAEIVVILLLTVVLSLASWRYVEQPFRAKRGRIGVRALVRAAVVTVLVCVAFGLFTDFSNGAPWRFGEQAQALLRASEDRDTACLRQGRDCHIGPADRSPRFLLWGDSHASALLPAFRAAGDALGVPGQAVLYPGCPPVTGYRRQGRNGPACADAVDRGLRAALMPEMEMVFLASRWTLVFEESRYGFEGGRPLVLLEAETGDVAGSRRLLEKGLHDVVQRLEEAGKRVVLIGPVPEMGWHVPHVLAQRLRFQHLLGDTVLTPDPASFMERNGATIELLTEVAERHGARLVLPHRWLCDPGGACRVLKDGRPLYFDTDHLTITGAGELTDMIRPYLASLSGVGG